MIGENIKALRKTHGLTQPRVRKDCRYLSEWSEAVMKRDKSNFDRLMVGICQKFNVSLYQYSRRGKDAHP